MVASLCGFGHKSPKRILPSTDHQELKSDEEDVHRPLTECIIKCMKPRCSWSIAKKKKIQPNLANHHQQDTKQQQQQTLKNDSNNKTRNHQKKKVATLEEWILASPGPNDLKDCRQSLSSSSSHKKVYPSSSSSLSRGWLTVEGVVINGADRVEEADDYYHSAATSFTSDGVEDTEIFRLMSSLGYSLYSFGIMNLHSAVFSRDCSDNADFITFSCKNIVIISSGSLKAIKEELLITGSPMKVTFKEANSVICISLGRDCKTESSFTTPSPILVETASSTAETNLPSKASSTLAVRGTFNEITGNNQVLYEYLQFIVKLAVAPETAIRIPESPVLIVEETTSIVFITTLERVISTFPTTGISTDFLISGSSSGTNEDSAVSTNIFFAKLRPLLDISTEMNPCSSLDSPWMMPLHEMSSSEAKRKRIKMESAMGIKILIFFSKRKREFKRWGILGLPRCSALENSEFLGLHGTVDSCARFLLDETPTPSMAVPESFITAFTSAKSTFTSPEPEETICKRSQYKLHAKQLSFSHVCSKNPIDLDDKQEAEEEMNDFTSQSTIARAAPEPVPPPIPAVINTMSELLRTFAMISFDSSAACSPKSGSPPVPASQH
nr:hypothetical protein Iba_chr11bCG1140 [Ipomoea batatas]